MKYRMIPVFLALFLILSGCVPAQNSDQSAAQGGEVLTVVATTYPVYLFASAVTNGVEGVSVERLNTGEASCLHDYTLSVDDMKMLEAADVIAMNGAGLEDFMDDALAASKAVVIDCSQGVALLENLSHQHEEGKAEDHDHGHWDPHIWMDPTNAQIMVSDLMEGLCQVDPAHAEDYRENGAQAGLQLKAWDDCVRDGLSTLEEMGISVSGLITFHDGFQYFSHAYDLPLLTAIEEEAGSEASAQEIFEITQMVKEHGIPVIFTEANGSDATARAIARETGCQVAQLTMLMDGPDAALSNYFDSMMKNMKAVVNGFVGSEVVA